MAYAPTHNVSPEMTEFGWEWWWPRGGRWSNRITEGTTAFSGTALLYISSTTVNFTSFLVLFYTNQSSYLFPIFAYHLILPWLHKVEPVTVPDEPKGNGGARQTPQPSLNKGILPPTSYPSPSRSPGHDWWQRKETEPAKGSAPFFNHLLLIHISLYS